MKINLADNIRNMRKQRGMVQDQLAEALGVSTAAVSKWERGAAVPELHYLMEMADVFGVSLDALTGYRVQDPSASAARERIRALQRKKEFGEAAAEAEKALVRYPDHFALVHQCGEMYQLKGIETDDPAAVNRAIELLRHAILLLPQNTDPEVDEYTIQAEIAQCWLSLGKREQGLELLKKYNACGVHNALIGMTCADDDGCSPAEAVSWLTKSFVDILAMLTRTILGYMNYYCRTENTAAALEAGQWMIGYLESIKADAGKTAYVDKLRSMLYAECANWLEQSGRRAEAEASLKKAFQIAEMFDAAPVCGCGNIRFCAGETAALTVYDDLGATALEAIGQQLRREDGSKYLCEFWEKLRKEGGCS